MPTVVRVQFTASSKYYDYFVPNLRSHIQELTDEH